MTVQELDIYIGKLEAKYREYPSPRLQTKIDKLRAERIALEPYPVPEGEAVAEVEAPKGKKSAKAAE